MILVRRLDVLKLYLQDLPDTESATFALRPQEQMQLTNLQTSVLQYIVRGITTVT